MFAFVLYFILFVTSTHQSSRILPQQDSFKNEILDNKKRKLISFKESNERKEERLDDSFSITSSVSPASTALSILRTPTAPDDFASPKTPTHSPQFFSFKRDNTSSSEEDEEYEYNEHNGHYKSDDNASTNTASSENMPKDDHLVSMMKKVAIAEKKPRKVIYEHEAVYFQDAAHNKMIGIKVRLPSALLDEDIVINLKMKGNYQYLCICNKINQHFFFSARHSSYHWAATQHPWSCMGKLQARTGSRSKEFAGSTRKVRSRWRGGTKFGGRGTGDVAFRAKARFCL